MNKLEKNYGAEDLTSQQNVETRHTDIKPSLIFSTDHSERLYNLGFAPLLKGMSQGDVNNIIHSLQKAEKAFKVYFDTYTNNENDGSYYRAWVPKN